MKLIWKCAALIALVAAGGVLNFIGHAKPKDSPELSASGAAVKVAGGAAISPWNFESRRKTLPLGVWGGIHIRMEVTPQGSTIELDCAHATIGQSIPLDRGGRFTVAGIYVPEHGGPVRRDEAAAGYPVRFSGRLSGKTLTLSIRKGDTRASIGAFTLRLGTPPIVRKCR